MILCLMPPEVLSLIHISWSHDSEGRGPAWSTSLFEDNAEFGLGFRVSLDKQMEHAIELLHEAAGIVGQELVLSLIHI